MYVPAILTAPLHPTGPVDVTRSVEAMTADRPLYDDGLVQVGVWECGPGTFGENTGAMNESMFMVAGRATVQYAGGAFDLSPGTLWTTPHQWSNTWSVHQTVRKLYVIDRRPGTPGAVTHVANAYEVELGPAAPRPNPIAGEPHERSVSIWEHDHLDVGVWECTPGEFTFRRDGYQEVFCVLSGHATLHVDHSGGRGQSFELMPGAVMLTPSGLTGRWVVHETIRKAYTVITD